MALSNSTPHINALKGQIAKRVLMPGDPKRAEWIAHKYLKNPKLVTDVRGILGFTGTYKKVPVTIMAHGMGIPSICIYVHELFSFYGAKAIYRIGSCGVTNRTKNKLGDVILAKSCWSDIPIKRWTKIKADKPNVFFPTPASQELIKKTAKNLGIKISILPALSNSFFYNSATIDDILRDTGTSVSEMEGFGLFLEGKSHKAHVACLLTVSDNIETGEQMTPQARATTFNEMALLGLESIIREKV